MSKVGGNKELEVITKMIIILLRALLFRNNISDADLDFLKRAVELYGANKDVECILCGQKDAIEFLEWANLQTEETRSLIIQDLRSKEKSYSSKINASFNQMNGGRGGYSKSFNQTKTPVNRGHNLKFPTNTK